MAFNDCKVIYFSAAEAHGNNLQDDANDNDDGDDGWTTRKGWPDRPKEWFASTDPDDGGELK